MRSFTWLKVQPRPSRGRISGLHAEASRSPRKDRAPKILYGEELSGHDRRVASGKEGSGRTDNQPYLSNPSVPLSRGRLAEVTIDGSSLTLQELVSVARGNSTVQVDRKALQRTRRGRAVLEKLLQEDEVIYGVNTGFGALSNVKVAPEDLKQLQANLLRSHASSVGKPHSTDVVRAMMLLRANTLIKGNSGIRPEIPQLIVALLRRSVTILSN